MLLYAFRDLDLGIYIRYHLDGFTVLPPVLTAKTMTLDWPITQVLFADDCALKPIKRTNSRQSSTNLLKHPRCLAWWSVFGRQKCSSSLVQTVSLKNHASPLIACSWKVSTLLNTLVAHYLVMDPSTKKLQLVSRKPVMHLEGST